MRALTYLWDGYVMQPLSSAMQQQARKQFVAGRTYRLDVLDERSEAEHRRYFALVHKGYQNLPETIDCFFRDSEALRHWALIKNGYFEKETYPAHGLEEASRIAKWLGHRDPDTDVTVDGLNVIIKKAKSQAFRKMSKREFQDSSEKVLAEISKLIGTDISTLGDKELEEA